MRKTAAALRPNMIVALEMRIKGLMHVSSKNGAQPSAKGRMARLMRAQTGA